jgi:hypothetical protein
MDPKFYDEQIKTSNKLFNSFYKDFLDLISLKSEELKGIPIENS